MSGKESGFVHNVSNPPDVGRFHCPPLGGSFAPRLIEIAVAGDDVWLAWHGYDEASGLDHVYARCGNDEPIRLTGQPGDHFRPTVTADRGGADVIWITEQRRLMHARVGGGTRLVDETDHWLRDAASWRDGDGLWCAVVRSAGSTDRLCIYRWDGQCWLQDEPIAFEDSIWRPSIATTGDQLIVAYEVYRHGRYTIQVRQGGEHAMTIDLDDEHALLPRLTPDASGTMWLSYVSEQIVQRDGVIGRAAHACCAMLGGEHIQVAPMFQGLLPIERYFGYDGLRRNPRLIATTDGAMHLLFEQQRSEDENWDNLSNGHLVGRTWRDGKWSEPRLWHDGGCCLALDHRTVQSPQRIALAYKGEHNACGDDFVITRIGQSDAMPLVEALDRYADWLAYVAPTAAERVTTQIDGREYQLLFGDFHCHSIASPDAEGFQDELYHFARDVAGVDFVGITDNDFYPETCFQESESQYQRQLVRKLHDGGRFIPFPGFEWTFHRNDEQQAFNHRSIILLDDEQRVVRRIEKAAHTEDAMRQTLSTMNVLAHAHHAQYQLLGTPAEANVEITSGWAVNIEMSDTAHDELNRGKRFGFIGGSDSHRMTPGLGGALAAVWATDLSREAIIEAVRARRCYATTGSRTAIDFRLDDTFMGGVYRWDGASPLPFHVSVRAARPLVSVTLVGPEGVLHAFDCDGPNLDATWVNMNEAPPWVYLRVEDDMPYREHPHNVCQAVGPWAWSSPIWIEKE